ncbi:cytochrome c biogenesis protein ResB [Robbsia sp. Bb-Pol-6]|uniref:Cytochrome c biogenesis protein ResB n=1 Tax=Robbsia betulipollinis TaxID=2981849 RepID=A0ABT3ZP42_9BURK|nr:cytochrome c biogenesis protein ResB [Robbsia betulipollinis]MCY0388318.1 cytochrome c biogenesis protein ResB [Robbsia betulipollinis]
MSSTPARVAHSRFEQIRRSLLDLFASMRFAISLLVILAIASIIGTVIKQSDPYPNYVNQFGPFWADIFRSLDMYNVYSAWWFMLILTFLIISVSLCVTRNGPKMIADARSWKDKVRESSLRSFGHRDEYASAMGQDDAVKALVGLLARAGYRSRTRAGADLQDSSTGTAGNTVSAVRAHDGATLIVAKRGEFSRIGYIFAHLAIVVICLGGLLDSGLVIRAQVWLLGKSPVVGNAPLASIGDEHRLSSSNPSFRGYAWVPEGQYVSTAILNEKDGTLLQNLPFSIQLNKFIVDYYSTGMPKLFASDIVVIDRETGKRTAARVEVNKPFTYDGVSIYQSSFEDGGTQLDVSAYPMSGATSAATPFKGKIGGTAKLPDGDTIEFANFRAINVENMTNGSGQQDARGVAKSSLKESFDERLGSGAKTSRPQNLHNIGPSLQYKIRDQSGQAREYNNYMVPTLIDGEQMFLAGVRSQPDDPFRYLRIPADNEGSVRQWMRVRAALQDPALRAAAAKAFAQRSLAGNAALSGNLEQSALRVLDLFAGDQPGNAAGKGTANGGFPAIADFIGQSVPAADREKAAGLLLRMLEGSIWDLWQIARVRAGDAPLPANAENSRFVQTGINALSDSFYYGAPVFLQLDNFKQIQASVFQLTRAPGENIVYLGSFLLVLGIFAMFYVRERRVWFWIRPAGTGTHVLMAMSAARKTLEFEKEFTRMRDAVRQTAQPSAAHGPDDGASSRDTAYRDTPG